MNSSMTVGMLDLFQKIALLRPRQVARRRAHQRGFPLAAGHLALKDVVDMADGPKAISGRYGAFDLELAAIDKIWIKQRPNP